MTASPLSNAVLSIAVRLSLTASQLQSAGAVDAGAISDLDASLRRWKGEYPELEPPLRALSGLSDPAHLSRVHLAEALAAAGENLSSLSEGEATVFLAEMRSYLCGILQEGGARRRARPVKERETILIVDDELAISRIIKRQLEKAGYGALLALSGAEAVKLTDEWYANETNPFLGVALVDMQLPDGRGEDVVERLRALDPDLVVVFFSGSHEPDGLLARVPRSSYLMKPAAFGEIVAHLRWTMDAP